ncbi:hypothetical protein [Dokdonia sinensis]|nr:hypothetical protein [Dokdonia sinensis]
MYPIIAILAGIEAYSEWGVNRERAYLFAFFCVFATGMFFFRRHYRKKFEKYKKNE